MTFVPYTWHISKYVIGAADAALLDAVFLYREVLCHVCQRNVLGDTGRVRGVTNYGGNASDVTKPRLRRGLLLSTFVFILRCYLL